MITPRAFAFFFLTLFLSLFAWGCGDFVSQTLQSDAAEPQAIFTHGTGASDTVLYLEVARTQAEQSRGLMERRSLAANRGMVFIFERPVQNSFWMKNTYIPLSIAFVSAEGVIVDIQDMEPLALDLHTPAAKYLFAIEANKGFFAKSGIKSGDHVRLEGI